MIGLPSQTTTRMPPIVELLEDLESFAEITREPASRWSNDLRWPVRSGEHSDGKLEWERLNVRTELLLESSRLIDFGSP